MWLETGVSGFGLRRAGAKLALTLELPGRLVEAERFTEKWNIWSDLVSQEWKSVAQEIKDDA